MIPVWAEQYLGPEEQAETDTVSGEPVSWGRPVIMDVPEEQFAELRGRCEVICVYPTWFVVTRRIQFSDMLMAHGPVRAVGVGPGGGFKWVRFDDGSIFGHSSFSVGARRELGLNPKLMVKCDAAGKEAGAEPRIPRRAIGRVPSGRSSPGGRRGR